jgi:ectoine hydroxylase-related dioxygenase (phytanoyl-CoA dioxygenase family)
MANDAPPDPAESYRERGFFIVPEVVVPHALIARVLPRCDAVAAGQYETGVPPWRRWNVGSDVKVQKIDQAHLADDAIFALVTHPAIGAWAARVTGARRVQLWATQLLTKPPGGGSEGHVGWHDDDQNWQFWRGEALTVWLALSDVGPDSGPLRFLPGSHRFPPGGDRGDAYCQDLDRQQQAILQGVAREAIEPEVDVLLPMGGLSVHHRLTLHCSGANRSAEPRRSIAINVRTERAEPAPGVEDYGFCSFLDHPRACPILYDTTTSGGRDG